MNKTPVSEQQYLLGRNIFAHRSHTDEDSSQSIFDRIENTALLAA